MVRCPLQEATPAAVVSGMAASAAGAYARPSLQTAQAAIAAVVSAVQMLDPAAVLAHGYALVRGTGGETVTSAGKLVTGPPAVCVEFRDGVANVQVINVRGTGS